MSVGGLALSTCGSAIYASSISRTLFGFVYFFDVHCAAPVSHWPSVNFNRTSFTPPIAASRQASSITTSFMSASVIVQEREVRQVISSALRSALAVPQHKWSEEFVVESLLSELTTNATSSNNSGSFSTEHNSIAELDEIHDSTLAAPGAVLTGKADSAAAKRNHSSRSVRSRSKSSKDNSMALESTKAPLTSEADLMLSPDLADLVDAFLASNAAAGAAGAAGDTQAKSRSNGQHRSTGSNEALQQQQQQQQQEHVTEELQSRIGQLLYDNYQQVEADDVANFARKFLTDLHHLVQHLQDQSDDLQGVCALCGRDMPLTKHHLIPRDVHKEFKKRGFTFDQLQSGLMVCRPCHSAIHRAVPDNKELAIKFRTLEDLQQHDAIAKFSAWASKQRVSSKTDATARHFRYRR